MPISLEDFEKLKKKKKKSKYNAVQILKKEIRFDSKLESVYHDWLLAEKEQGNILYFLRQVPFHLLGNIRYIVDFQIFWHDGQVEYVDVKGVMTDVSRNKIKQVVCSFPVDIKIVTRKEINSLK